MVGRDERLIREQPKSQSRQMTTDIPESTLKLYVNFQVAISSIAQGEQLSIRSLVTHELSRLLLTFNPKTATTLCLWTIHLSQNCPRTVPRISFSIPLYHSQRKSFQNNLHLSSPNLLYQSPSVLGWQTWLSSPPHPAAAR